MMGGGQRKGVAGYPGVYASADRKWTYLPMQDIRDRLWSLQAIDESGAKRFAKGGRVEGCFHVLGGCN